MPQLTGIISFFTSSFFSGLFGPLWIDSQLSSIYKRLFTGTRSIFILMFILIVERVAVKIIEKTGMDQKALKMLTREIANMDTVRHPAIVR